MHVRDKADEFQTLRDLRIGVGASAFYPSIQKFYDSGELPFYRVGDVDGMVEVERATKIPAKLCDEFPTLKRVRRGDVLFTKGGAIDRAGYVIEEGAVSRDLIFLKTSRLPESRRLWLFTYFRTAFFRRMLLRSSSQTAQPHLTLPLVRELPIFLASDRLSDAVASAVVDAYHHADQADNLLRRAEDTLLEAIGLADWEPPEPLSYTASASAAFADRRLDARFFAPRIQALLDILSGDGLTVGDLATPRRQKFEPGACERFDYIEIGDIDGVGSAGSTHLACIDAPSRATWHVKPDDIITSTVRPIRRLSAQIAPEQDGCVCSSGFVVIQPRSIAPELLLTYLLLPVICELLDLYASASMYPAINAAHIFGLHIPKIDTTSETQVVDNMHNAKAAKVQAARLLETAKQAVEIALEDGEDTAIAFLNQAKGSN